MKRQTAKKYSRIVLALTVLTFSVSTGNAQTILGFEEYGLNPSKCLVCKTLLDYWGGPISSLKRYGGSLGNGITVHYRVTDSSVSKGFGLPCEAVKKTYEQFRTAMREEIKTKFCHLCKRVAYMLNFGGDMSIKQKNRECFLTVTPAQTPIEKQEGVSTTRRNSTAKDLFKVSRDSAVVRSGIMDTIINPPASLKAKMIGGAVSGNNVFSTGGNEKTKVTNISDSGQNVPRFGEYQNVDEEPTVIQKTAPKYPEIAFANRIEGMVVLGALVDIDGRVKDQKVVRTSNEIFNQAAIECLKDWIFKPAILNGTPVIYWYQDSLFFRIK